MGALYLKKPAKREKKGKDGSGRESGGGVDEERAKGELL